MITWGNYNPKKHPLTPEQERNALDLMVAANALLDKAGLRDRVPTSGVRTFAEHEAIYARINERRTLKGVPALRVPKRSNHLITIKNDLGKIVTNPNGCTAVDLEDKDGQLDKFCLANLDALKELGLYLEEPSMTAGWTHVQIVAPASGNRVFLP